MVESGRGHCHAMTLIGWAKRLQLYLLSGLALCMWSAQLSPMDWAVYFPNFPTCGIRAYG